MNFLWLINKSHHGDPSLVNEYSSLNTHMHVLDRKKSSKGDPPFEHLEDIALHSFYARVVALFHICISELAPSCDIHHPEAVNAYIHSLHPDQFLAVVAAVREMAFTRAKCVMAYPISEKHPLKPNLNQGARKHQVGNHWKAKCRMKARLLNSNPNH
jgi:hypothetical protein